MKRDFLKLITREEDDEFTPWPGELYLDNINGEPVLAYIESQGSNPIYLDKGGSNVSRLIKCSDLKDILTGNMIKGTKFLASSSNPTLYYLFPGNPDNDALFTSDNNFIPTIRVNELIETYEANGFDDSEADRKTLTQNSVRSMKACDNWFVDLDIYEQNIEEIDAALDRIYNHYQDFDYSKEVQVGSGYAVEVFENSIAVNLTSGTTYTDTINLEDWIWKLFNKDKLGQDSEIHGKLDISFMYSIEGNIHCGMQTIKISSVMSSPVIIELEDVQLEYIGKVLKIYPLKNEVDEVIINDCVFTVYNK